MKQANRKIDLDIKMLIGRICCFLACALFATVGVSASFPCELASTPIETSICSDQELSSLDEIMGKVYSLARTLPPADLRDYVLEGQRIWLDTRKKLCPQEVPTLCLRPQLIARIDALADTLGDLITGWDRFEEPRSGLSFYVPQSWRKKSLNPGSGKIAQFIGEKFALDGTQMASEFAISIIPLDKLNLEFLSEDSSTRCVLRFKKNGDGTFSYVSMDKVCLSPKGFLKGMPFYGSIANHRSELQNDARLFLTDQGYAIQMNTHATFGEKFFRQLKIVLWTFRIPGKLKILSLTEFLKVTP